MKKHRTTIVFIACDRDEARGKAAIAPADELIGMGIDCYRVLFPKGMDANYYGCKVKPTARSLGVLLNTANWLGKGKLPAVTVPAVEPASVAHEPEAASAQSPTEEVTEAQPTAAKEEIASEVPEPVLFFSRRICFA